MNIQNDKEVIVYKNEFGKYSVMLRKKNQDNSYEVAYIPIQFNKGVEVDNKTPIKIKNAWLTFYKLDTQDGKQETRFVIKCSDFEVADEPAKEVAKEENPFKQFGDNIKTEFDFGEQIEITPDELPF